ncbi:hypothetical protein MMC08_001110 [Hypocenomyce scalaris]|nr:hypothetical protein [Hypocenomyce scalaris]
MTQPATFDYTHGGFFHLAITAPDPDELCERVVAAGGKKIGETVLPFVAQGETDSALYVQDPWDNNIEVVSCSFEQLLGNRDASN